MVEPNLQTLSEQRPLRDDLLDLLGEKYQKRLEKQLGRVTVFTGGRGSGKTLSMTIFLISALIKGHQIWSNYPIRYIYDYPILGRRFLQSTPLDMNSLYTFDSSLAEGFVAVDEINLWASSRRSMSVANRLINSTMQLIRKRKLSFMFTVQDFGWLDNQLRFQTDTLIRCRDQYFYRPWELEPGQFITMQMYDMSGISTGTPFTEYPTSRNCRKVNLWAKWAWHCYDSWQEFDVLEASKSIKILDDKKILDLRSDSSATDVSNEQEIFSALRLTGRKEFDAREIESFMRSNNVQKDMKYIGREMKKYGWQYKQTRKGNFYVLSNPEAQAT